MWSGAEEEREKLGAHEDGTRTLRRTYEWTMRDERWPRRSMEGTVPEQWTQCEQCETRREMRRDCEIEYETAK